MQISLIKCVICLHQVQQSKQSGKQSTNNETIYENIKLAADRVTFRVTLSSVLLLRKAAESCCVTLSSASVCCLSTVS